MARLVVVPMIPYTKGSSLEVRTEYFFQWCELWQKTNPTWMLPLGVKKRWWQLFMREHPFTTKYKRPERS